MIHLESLPWGDYDVLVQFDHPHVPAAKAQVFTTAVEGLRWAARELGLPYRLGTSHPSSMEIEVGYQP